MLDSLPSAPQPPCWLLEDDSGRPAGKIGCVGLAQAPHGQGIGLAMVMHIGWVYRASFYSRLGYAPWQAFDISWRTL